MDEALVPEGFFPRREDPAAPPDAASAGLTVVAVKEQLRDLISQLLEVTDVQQAKLLNIAIQRRRVVLILLQESAGAEAEGDYHKEMSLLNRMLQGEEVDPTSPQDADREAAAVQAEQVLAARGADPLAAARIMSVLDAIVSRVDSHDGPRLTAARQSHADTDS